MIDENRVKATIDNYKRVKDNIAEAAIKAGRRPEDIRLMCVTKTVEPPYINRALELGADLIGENRVQEYLLQTNKVKQIVGEVDMIQSVDSIKLAKEISRVSKNKGITSDVLVEVNIGLEESKSGTTLDELNELISEISELECIRVKGLMTIPPICDENEVKKYFSLMYKTFIDLKAKNSDNISMEILSMGMSGDYEAAVAEGSNIVRVGSAIFGARKYF